MNLFESFEDLLNNDLLKNIQSSVSDTKGDFEMASKGIYYTLVAGLIRRSNSDMGSGMLFNQILEKYNKLNLGDNYISDLPNKDFASSVSEEGLKIISQIFPAYKSPLLSMISSYAGTSKSNTEFLSGITASSLINIIGKKITTEKMDKEDMVYFLKQNNEALFRETPEALIEKMIPALGLQELNNLSITAPRKDKESKKENPHRAVEEAYEKARFDPNDRGGKGINSKLIIGLIGLLLLGGLSYFIYNNQMDQQNEEEVEVIEEEVLPVDSIGSNTPVKPMRKDSAVTTDSTASVPTALSALEIYLNDVNQPKGKVVNFSNTVFVKGTSTLTEEIKPQLNELIELMRNRPELQIKVISSEGGGDKKIANKRAFEIKKYLQNNGIDASRVDAGLGEDASDMVRFLVVSK